jgi:DNA helicase-2/ATP-dependent DNA helicase PcrA
MTWSDGIDGVHKAIAGEPASPVHVLAGPGTGKTFAMMRRIARLLEEGVAPDRILAVSFTRTAARDLEGHLLALGVEGATKVQASTLHSLCFGVLAKEAVFAVTGRTPRPLMSFEINQLVNDLVGQFGGKKPVNGLLEAYDAAWARLQHEEAGAPRSAEDQRFEVSLLDWLRFHRAVLVGELVPVTLRFAQQNPALNVLPSYDAVLVDEFQDLNKADQTLVQELASGGSLTVIGDDNQSIYSFRHANPEAIRTFPADHAGTVPFEIGECRRCPPNIVTMSNSVISHNSDARLAPLASLAGRAPAHVVIVQHATVEDEADAVAAFIDKYLTDHPELAPGQVLVLSPRRLMGNAVKDALIQRHRNALSYFWEDALDNDAGAEGFCLLTLMVDPNDRASYRAWLGLGHPKGYAPAYARVRARAAVDGTEPRAVVEQLAAGTMALPHTKGLVERHKILIARLAEVAGLQGLPLVEKLWSATSDTQAIRTAAQTIGAVMPSPAELLKELRTVITQPELPASDGDIIRVMSLYKSKGLTASLVVVVGCASGAIPTIDSSLPLAEQDAKLREQRRLFYVAITRATDTLVLSSVTRMPLGTALRAGITPAAVFRQGHEQMARIGASPFLAELGGDAPSAVKGTDWRTAGGF